MGGLQLLGKVLCVAFWLLCLSPLWRAVPQPVSGMLLSCAAAMLLLNVLSYGLLRPRGSIAAALVLGLFAARPNLLSAEPAEPNLSQALPDSALELQTCSSNSHQQQPEQQIETHQTANLA